MAVRQGRREIISFEGLRQDGRRASEIRHVRIQFGIQPEISLSGGGLSERPDGSVIFQQGETVVRATVRGPRQPRSRRKSRRRHPQGLHPQERGMIICEYSQAAMCKPNLPFGSGSESVSGWVSAGERRDGQTIGSLIEKTFRDVILTQLLPRTEIWIGVHVLRTDGGTLSCALNAVSLALIQAGIPMRDTVISCSSGFIDGTCILDCNGAERSKSIPILNVAIQPRSLKIVMTQLDARLPLQELKKLTQVAIAGCLKINRSIKRALEDYAESQTTIGGEES